MITVKYCGKTEQNGRAEKGTSDRHNGQPEMELLFLCVKQYVNLALLKAVKTFRIVDVT